jgi:hypothetical protein
MEALAVLRAHVGPIFETYEAECYNGPIEYLRWLCFCLPTKKERDAAKATPAFFDNVVALFKEQKGRCAFSGTPLTWDPTDLASSNISLDRIESDEGYSPGNVRLVTVQVNRVLGCHGDALGLAMLAAIAKVTVANGADACICREAGERRGPRSPPMHESTNAASDTSSDASSETSQTSQSTTTLWTTRSDSDLELEADAHCQVGSVGLDMSLRVDADHAEHAEHAEHAADLAFVQKDVWRTECRAERYNTYRGYLMYVLFLSRHSTRERRTPEVFAAACTLWRQHGGRCCVSGVPLEFSAPTSRIDPFRLSIVRKAGRGHGPWQPDAILLVTHWVAAALMRASPTELADLAHRVLLYNKNQLAQ